MIPKKIKAVRELLGITEIQVSNMICVNSYKYKRCERDVNYISSEMLILLSIIYKVPFEMFLLEKYTVEDILESEYLNSLKGLDRKQIESALKDNLCRYFLKKRKKANYTTINMILQNERKKFAANLKDIRGLKQLAIINISSAMELSDALYKTFESASVLPDPSQLICLINYLNIAINSLISL